jgi:predicted HTH transcriptional regulator
MSQTTLTILGIAILTLAFLVSRTGKGVAKKGFETSIGICQSALDQTVRKNTNKQKILKFLKEREKTGNEEIREHLGVSRQSVVRYMDELETEGKVEQIGSIGHAVFYRLK